MNGTYLFLAGPAFVENRSHMIWTEVVWGEVTHGFLEVCDRKDGPTFIGNSGTEEYRTLNANMIAIIRSNGEIEFRVKNPLTNKVTSWRE